MPGFKIKAGKVKNGMDTLVVADSYFGSLDSLIALKKEGYEALLSCRQDRPNFLFRDLLCSGLAPGATACAGGSLDEIKFAAAVTSSSKNVCAVSTVFGGNVSDKAKTITCLVPDRTTTEIQSTFQTQTERRSEMWDSYSVLMDFVDECDREVLAMKWPFRMHHWSAAQMRWLISVTLQVNARRVFQSCVMGHDELSVRDWTYEVIDALTGDSMPFEVAHALSNQKGVKKRCKICTKNGRNTRTVKRCRRCGPICKKCDSSPKKTCKSEHFVFASNGSLPLGV